MKKLIIILIIFWGAAYLFSGPVEEWKAKRQNDNPLKKIAVEDVEKIEIVKNGATTTLSKEGESLKVEGTKDFYVDEETSEKITQGLLELKEAGFDLVSSKEDKKEEFGTATSAGLNLKIFPEGENAISLIIGKLSGDFLKNYISLPDLSNTYSIKENLLAIFDKTEWRSKVIFSSDKNKITKIRFQHPDQEFAVERKELEYISAQTSENATSSEDEADKAAGADLTPRHAWQGVAPYEFQAKGEELDEVLEIMANLEAAKIPAQVFAGTGLKKHALIVEATGEGINNTIMVGDLYAATSTQTSGKELYYAKKGDSDNIYLITSEQREILDKYLWQVKEGESERGG